MTAIRGSALVVMGTLFLSAAAPLFGQIVINEIVEDEQDFESTDIGDTREFIELYNAGGSAVDISGWQFNYYLLTGGTGGTSGTYFAFPDTINPGTVLAPGDYFVLGPTPAVPNVDQVIPSATDWFPNSTTAAGGTIFELWNGDRLAGGTSIVDAVAIDTFRNTELANANQAQLDQIAAGQTVGPAARGGWWGQVESNNAHPTDATFPNLPMSIGRYRDGYDHNVNGRDFGMIPATPGTTNNLAEVPVHAVPDVDGMAVGTELRGDYYASFKLPKVIDPTQVGPAGASVSGVPQNINPTAIPPSPQLGKAIIAYDETGGGNAVYSDEYSNEFKLYAYLDPTPFNNTTNNSTRSEASIYGITGTTDLFFGTPNSAGLLSGQPTGFNIPSSANGSTGLGWLIQRRTTNAAGTQTSNAVLQLIDFNDGGDGVLADNDWQIKAEINLTGVSAAWHVLGIDYDPVTGNVTAVYDNQTFNFSTTTDLVGNFYVGYRENLPGTGNAVARPPTYDLFVETSIPGDHNGDGVVDLADYVAWRKDPAGNGGAAGYTAWVNNFGEPGTGSGGGGAVPEPAAMALVVFGLVGAAGWRRSRG